MTALAVTRVERPGEAWDSFVRSVPNHTAFHRSAWERINRRALRHETLFLEARDHAGIRGVLPLVRVRSRLFGHYLMSMPFVSHGGPLGDATAMQALVAHAVVMARESGADLLEFRSRSELPLELIPSHRKVSVLLDLPESTDALFKSFPAKLRSQIRKPQKEGVTVRMGPEALDDFYRVFAMHMRDLGTPTLDRSFFKSALEEFGSDAWIAVAYLNEAPVACGMGFRWGQEFEITWASSLRAFSRIAPNMLLYWSLMERAIAEGCTLFNFGRCTPGANTHKFKLQWGSRDETLYWYQWSPGGVAATPSPDTGAFSLGPRIWRKLPLPVANLLGPHIVRLIP